MTVQFEPARLGAPCSFSGAKVLVFLGQDLLVIRRDHTPGIPWPGYLDWPGGGRDNGETPEACALRETREEVGLHLSPDQFVWRHLWQGPQNQSWFFAAHLAPEDVGKIVFGSEGLGWQLMRPALFLDRSDAIPHFKTVLSLYLAE